MNIAGVDVSTVAISMAVLSGQDGRLLSTCEYWIPPLKKEPNKAERCRNVWKHPYRVELLMMSVSAVYFEQPMGRHIKSVAEIERIIGSIIAATPDTISVSLIGPSEWKAKVGLPGNAGKPEIFAFAEQLYPELEGTSQDVHDASCIGRAGYIESAKESA